MLTAVSPHLLCRKRNPIGPILEALATMRDRTGALLRLRRANGSLYYRGRVWLFDKSRVRVDVPDRHCRDDVTARLYIEACQEREDELGSEGPLYKAKLARLAAEKKKNDATRGETCEQYFKRFLTHRKESGKIRREDPPRP
jgi:hypothetical protein